MSITVRYANQALVMVTTRPNVNPGGNVDPASLGGGLGGLVSLIFFICCIKYCCLPWCRNRQATQTQYVQVITQPQPPPPPASIVVVSNNTTATPAPIINNNFAPAMMNPMVMPQQMNGGGYVNPMHNHVHTHQNYTNHYPGPDPTAQPQPPPPPYYPTAP